MRPRRQEDLVRRNSRIHARLPRLCVVLRDAEVLRVVEAGSPGLGVGLGAFYGAYVVGFAVVCGRGC